VPYVTGGITPDWVRLVQAMADAGADAIEIGIPFSDPVMDGPTIQEASEQALRRGVTPVSILQELGQAEAPGVPLVTMTYYNIVFRAGHRRFARALSDAGMSGAILPDVCLEELGDWEADAAAEGIETVLLAAPVTPDDRMAELCRRSRGFIYGVNLMGVTGERRSLAESAGILAKRLKATTTLPVIMGFGISTVEQAVAAAAPADGLVVASALMRRVLDGDGPEEIAHQVGTLRAALDAS
jgi:tryptophan synthase alpha chain